MASLRFPSSLTKWLQPLTMSFSSWVRNIWVFSPLVPSKREKNVLVLLSLYIQFVNLIVQKLKSKHTSLKKYTNWAKLIHFSLVLREREEKKKYFAPKFGKNCLCQLQMWSSLQFGIWNCPRTEFAFNYLQYCKFEKQWTSQKFCMW